MNIWEGRFAELPPEKRLKIRTLYEGRSKEWHVASRAGDLTDYVFTAAIGVVETRAPQLREWTGYGERELRLKVLTVCARCMDEQEDGQEF